MKIPQIIEGNKHLFGTYSTMALANIRNILDHIATLACIENDFNADSDDYWHHPCMEIINPQNLCNDVTKADFVTEKLKSHFPFVVIMAEAKRQKDIAWAKNQAKKAFENRDFQKQQEFNKKQKSLLSITNADIYRMLNNLFRVLTSYRHYTSHYLINYIYFNEGSNLLKYNEQPLSYNLNDYFTIALRDTAQKYSYSPEALSFIQSSRYKIENRRKILDTDFFLSIQHRNGDSNPKNLHISGVGVALLICLFLEKKYVNVFLQKLPIYGSYKKQSMEANIIRQTFGIHTAKLPKERIVSEKSDFSIGMDMLNELKRCPKALFSTLSYADQNAFRIVSSDMNDVLQVRHTDRFAQLSLEYIDRRELFSDIRFHLNMGKLRYLKTADKHCIDGISRVRVLEDKINAFGRIHEFEARRKELGFVECYDQGGRAISTNTNIEIRDFEHVKRDDTNPDSYPYIIDTYTHYILENNKIGMHIGDYWPDLIKLDEHKWRVYNDKPTCFMSSLELPAMMFHMMLCGSDATESLIKAEVDKYKKLFGAMANGTLTKENISGFGIAEENIPQKVIDCVNGKTSGKGLDKQIKKEIDEMLADTNLRIERLKSDKRSVASTQNKMGKRGFRSIQPGKIADWLAADIVKHQPSLLKGVDYGTDRITGMNYRVMQSTIATFNATTPEHSLEELKRVFSAAQLIQCEKKEHPFLYKALDRNPQNTIDLYEFYLSAKQSYYQSMRRNIENGENVKLPYLNTDRNKWMRRGSVYYSRRGEIYLKDMPIELPRQMFDKKIKEALAKLPSMKDVDMQHSNVTFLIAEYLKKELKDDFQPFYQWNRNYRFTDMMICEENRSTRALSTHFIPVALREEIWEKRSELKAAYKEWALPRLSKNRDTERLSPAKKSELLDARIAKCRNEYQKNEKIIRRYKVQDALMFMMVKDMFGKGVFTAESKEFALSAITPDAKRGILSEVIPIDFKFSMDGKTYTIHSNGMKIKNYGDFYKLINDKRMKSILKIITHNVIDKDLLEKEFSSYDDKRPEAIEIVFEFEKAAYSKYPELEELVLSENHFDFGTLLRELQAKKVLSQNDGHYLSQIRNAFSHNSYPRNLRITSNIPEIAQEMINIFRITTPLKTKK